MLGIHIARTDIFEASKSFLWINKFLQVTICIWIPPHPLFDLENLQLWSLHGRSQMVRCVFLSNTICNITVSLVYLCGNTLVSIYYIISEYCHKWIYHGDVIRWPTFVYDGFHVFILSIVIHILLPGKYDRKALWKSLPITVNTSSLTWQQAEVTIPATNVSYVIGFEGRISIPYKSDIAIDDVQFKVSCQ